MSAEAQTPPPTTPPALGRVLAVVRKLIDYGKQIAATVQQRAATPGITRFTLGFGTTDIAIILARIANGLCRAAALEARLCQQAATGQDLAPPTIRMSANCRPRAPRQAAPPDARPELQPQPAESAGHKLLVRLPTEEEIAAQVRTRPIGAVIADICHDLGIAVGHLDRAFWGELRDVIMTYRGNLIRFFRDMDRRLFAFCDECHATPLWPPPPLQMPVPATGPP